MANGAARRPERLQSNDLLQFSSYLNFFEIPLDGRWPMAGNLPVSFVVSVGLFTSLRAKCLIIFYLSANWSEVSRVVAKTKKER